MSHVTEFILVTWLFWWSRDSWWKSWTDSMMLCWSLHCAEDEGVRSNELRVSQWHKIRICCRKIRTCGDENFMRCRITCLPAARSWWGNDLWIACENRTQPCYFSWIFERFSDQIWQSLHQKYLSGPTMGRRCYTTFSNKIRLTNIAIRLFMKSFIIVGQFSNHLPQSLTANQFFLVKW